MPPLMQGKSKEAFSSNVAEEMKSKPQNQALAIAYAIKRKNMKKMAAGGMAEGEANEKELYSDAHRKLDSHALAHSIIQKLAYGGEVEGHEMGDMPEDHMDDSNIDDEMFSDEADGAFDKAMMFDGGYAEGGDVNPKLEAAHDDSPNPKKRMLAGIMARIRAKQMGNRE